MTDPLDALRMPVDPVDPDPRFAAELRGKLRRAVLIGEDMTTTTTTPPALTPYLAVSDARAALDFYVEVFGAVRRGEPIVMDDGRVGHAELQIGGSVLMLAEEFEEIGHTVSRSGGASIRIEVPDPGRAVNRAVELGSDLIRPVTASQYGRSGTIRDPFGQRWLVSEAVEAAQAESKRVPHGHAGYFTFQVPDDEVAKEFYGAVLGWQFAPGSVDHAWRMAGNGLQGGLWGGQRQIGWKLMYAVDDLNAALDRVRAQGGQAGEIEHEPYGLAADCTDNQGIEFWLWQQP
jgi:uncharacterized glyoxalase superfamily protein PhnB